MTLAASLNSLTFELNALLEQLDVHLGWYFTNRPEITEKAIAGSPFVTKTQAEHILVDTIWYESFVKIVAGIEEALSLVKEANLERKPVQQIVALIAACQDCFDRADHFFQESLFSEQTQAQLDQLQENRLWRSWVENFRIELNDSLKPLAKTRAAFTPCWRELAEARFNLPEYR
jgi:hypothetical protein